MHDHRSEEALTDAALDREIEQAMAVDPAPEFMARVRARVAAEPNPDLRIWRVRWPLAIAGLVVTAAVIAMVSQETPHTRLQPEGGPRVPAAVMADRTPSGFAPASGVAPHHDVLPPDGRSARTASRQVSNRGARAVNGARRDLWVFPEVVVSGREAEALRELVADAHAGRLTIVPAAGVDPAEDASDPVELVIKPLEIQPLVKLSPEELEGEVE